jgi:hypothetical protein
MENLKKALSRVLATTSTVAKAYEDKKIVMTEWIKIGASSVGLTWVFKHLPEIEADLANATEEGINKMMEELKLEFDIPQDKLEEVIEEGLHILLTFITMTGVLKKGDA